MDDDEGMSNTENPSVDPEKKDNEEIVEDDQNHSGMQQGEKTEAENFAKNSNTITDCELKTESLDSRNDFMDLRPQISFEMFEKTTEFERKFLQHRKNEELHFSDISSESNDSTNSDKSCENIDIWKPERQIKCKVGEHSNSIPGFYDCDEPFSGFLAFNEVLRHQNNEIPIEESFEDITWGLSELLKEGLKENSSPDQTDSQKQRVSPETGIPYHNSSLEGKRPIYRKETPHFLYSELLHVLTKISKTSGEKKDMPQHSNNSKLDNARLFEEKAYESSDLGLYSMISSPISSKYIELERTQSSPYSINSRTDHTYGMQMPVLNPSPISPDGLSNDKISPTAQIDNSSISKTYEAKLSRSVELPSSSNINSPKSISCSSCNLSVRNKSTSCFDIPSSSKGLTQLPSKAVYKPKCSRLLNFDESDSSGDDAKGNFSEGKENRMKRKLVDSSDTCASNAENHPDVSENAEISSEFCSKKPRKNEENESTITVLRPLEIINSENLEADKSFRKRLYSSSKTSDIEQSDEECKSEKKPKLCTSSESES